MDSQDKVASGNAKRTRNEFLETKRRHGLYWDSLDDNDPVKLRYLQKFRQLRSDRALDMMLAAAASNICRADRADTRSDPFAVQPRSCWSLGDAHVPLAASVLDQFRGGDAKGQGLRPFAEHLKVHGRLYPHLTSPIAPALRDFDVKALQAKLRKEPHLTCSDIFGSEVCRRDDKSYMRRIMQSHTIFWQWLSQRWLDDFLEGALLVQFRAVAEDAAQRTTFWMVGRRIGNPRKVILIEFQRADDGCNEPVVFPLDVFIEDLKRSYIQSHGLMKRLLVNESAVDVVFTACSEVRYENCFVDGAPDLLRVKCLEAKSERTLWTVAQNRNRARHGEKSAAAAAGLLDLLEKATKFEREMCNLAGKGDDSGSASDCGSDVVDYAEAVLNASDSDPLSEEELVESDVDPFPLPGCDGGGHEEPRPATTFSGSVANQRTQAMALAMWYVKRIQKSDHFAACSPRVQVQEAFDRIDADGFRFWGASGIFTRRRSAVDSFLSCHYSKI